jgi:ParB-like nuclease domain
MTLEALSTDIKRSNDCNASSPNRKIPIDQIRIDPRVQARVDVADDVVNEYAEALKDGDVFPPVTVFSDGCDYILADGWHRLKAAKRAKICELDCEVRAGGLREAILFAVGANSTHGRMRSTADKHNAVSKLFEDEEWCLWSDREIAKVCRVSHQLVGKLRAATGRATSERRYRTKSGQIAEMKIGQTERPKKPTARAKNPAAVTNAEETIANADSVEREVASAVTSGADVSDYRDGDKTTNDRTEQYSALVDFASYVMARLEVDHESVALRITATNAREFNCLLDRVRKVVGR